MQGRQVYSRPRPRSIMRAWEPHIYQSNWLNIQLYQSCMGMLYSFVVIDMEIPKSQVWGRHDGGFRYFEDISLERELNKFMKHQVVTKSIWGWILSLRMANHQTVVNVRYGSEFWGGITRCLSIYCYRISNNWIVAYWARAASLVYLWFHKYKCAWPWLFTIRTYTYYIKSLEWRWLTHLQSFCILVHW